MLPFRTLTVSVFCGLALAGCFISTPSTQPTTEDIFKATPREDLKRPETPATSAPATTPMSNSNTEQAIQVDINKLRATLYTSEGNIEIAFYPESPRTIENFLKLATTKFYDGVSFHRVIKGFMLQTGDPNSKDADWSNDGMGGPGYKFADEFNTHKLVAGSVAMANSGPDTNGSQFFVVTAEATPWLDGKHTNFGYVVNGMDVVKKIEGTKTNENDHPLNNITLDKVTVTGLDAN